MNPPTDLLDTLRIGLPGALDGTIGLELFNVLDELCRKAHVWRQTVTVPLTAGVTSYTITPPSGAVLAHVQSVDHPTLESNVRVDQAAVTLLSAPTAADAATPLSFTVSLAPETTDDDPPVAVYRRHHQALVHGVMSRMMAQTSKPYSNTRLAEFHGRRFRYFMALAVPDTDHGGVRQAQVWRFPRFGA